MTDNEKFCGVFLDERKVNFCTQSYTQPDVPDPGGYVKCLDRATHQHIPYGFHVGLVTNLSSVTLVEHTSVVPVVLLGDSEHFVFHSLLLFLAYVYI
jgi:hypothetical protein